MNNFWLVKSEPKEYGWEDLLKTRSATWDGVRNFQARNNLACMKKGDLVYFYHSGKNPEIVGIAKVVKEHFQDPTSQDPRWLSVELAADKPLTFPVTLKEIKKDKRLKEMKLVKQSRLSVMPVTEEEFYALLSLSAKKDVKL
ncbi:MAG: ubiquinol-cytochrome C reductase [Elusimicrobia bacterium RIFCSPLOWO2_02_FULL_39_32]|nr:MAG: ubiquinol-cytochrome C reductase [Elusimicrobia bacterium GWA2_38_7]OGR80064.1 MAG: ubiquinol-cytochrome C reductase [Elusimicrobia bacterium RIFCSPHIGHO2_02_FULL_39_36]OGR91140.1 MAG: ubiquinol-cytochrome C reductase [Elusimicrobia bacterium RIFCSPLOWO2_02_FULL_39_32]OGS00108.1 MAG: ubiquinol-cytochrome C reductase [Elusimicrobia bacterium RIFCSPLOWO2_12_FULL_39_28]